ncbi:MAG: hypothetical protein IPQ07_01640 [Myxococcales bacterium]|nr:hypothetical protein [Myxococcales bacterium]
MHTLGKLTALLALVSASACVTEDAAPPEADNALDWRSGGKGDGQTCEFDTQSATTYLANFLYKDVGAETGGGHRYRVGFTFDRHAILPNGNEADFTMYLLPEGRAIVNYAEEHRIDSSRSEVINETVVVSRYSVDATSRALKIDGFGTGTPMTATDGGHCAPAYNFTYSGDLRTAGLSGGKTVAYAGTSSGYVIDPDHLDQVPSETARRWFQEDVASGKIVVIRK